ncbi:hypothetical protein HK096_000312, partial [Nowakowskiella sp. JEL0078]
MATDVLNLDQTVNHSITADNISFSSVIGLPGSFPSDISITNSFENESLRNYVLKNFDSVEQVTNAVAEASWNVLEQFSRVTRFYRTAAGKVLDLEPIRPYVTPQLLALAGLENKQADTLNPAFAILSEYEPARVYLAQWSHDLQVTRVKEMERMQQQIDEQMKELLLSDDFKINKSSEESMAASNLSWSTMSHDISKLTEKRPVVRSKSWWKSSSIKPRQISKTNIDDSKSDSEEEDQVVWDETVEAETGLGMFEVLSTDTTPPPRQPTRLPPLGRNEWESYFDSYVIFPDWLEVSDEENFKFDQNCGKLKVSEFNIKKRIFAGGIEPEIRTEVWAYLLGIYPWNSNFLDRQKIVREKKKAYKTLKRKWLSTAKTLVSRKVLFSINHYNNANASGSNLEELEAEMQASMSVKLSDSEERVRDAFTRIEKDVMRTDRSHKFYESKPVLNSRKEEFLPLGIQQLDSLRDVLMTFSVSHQDGFDLGGYVQGMSDLCSPLLVEGGKGSEAWAFWGFVFVMKRL